MSLLTKDRRRFVARTSRRLSQPFARATATWRMLPTFAIVGAQRAGTTSLYKYLADHPDVGRVRLGKGVHYFDTNAAESLGWYRAHFPLDPDRVPFKRTPEQVGEGAPYYMFHPECPRRIDEALPAAKIIAILRDPIERAHSHWAHETARGFETLDFEAALEAEPSRLAGTEELLAQPAGRSFEHQHHSYVARGQYAEQIERLWGVFGRDRVLVLSSNELFADPSHAYASTLSFLGLSPHEPEFEVHNSRSYSKIAPGTETLLAARFASSNERLVELLGPKFDFRRN